MEIVTENPYCFADMKLLRIHSLTVPPEIISASDSQDHATLISSLNTQKNLTPNHFPKAMEKLGYEVFDFVYNYPPQSHLWDKSKTPSQALRNCVKTLKPDILYFERAAISVVPNELKLELKAIPHIRLMVGYWGAQLTEKLDKSIFLHFDFLFSIDEQLTKLLNTYSKKAYMLRACFDGHEASFSNFAQRSIEFGFFGTSGYGFEDHQQRFLFLRAMAKATPIKLWCYEPPWKRSWRWKYNTVQLFSKLPSPLLKFLNRTNFRKVSSKSLLLKSGVNPYPIYYSYKPLSYEFPQKVYQPVFGHSYEQKIQDCRLVLNCHVDDPRLYGNMRSYEVTGLGSVLITDRKELMQRLFKLDEEIVAFSSQEEAIEKFEFLRKNPKTAEEIAQKGQKRTLKDHTIYQRAEIIHEKIQTHLKTS